MDPEFDHIVVGAGSAGCAVAAGLSADERRRVLLLEAGGSDRRFWIRTPIGYGKTFYDRQVNWRYQTEADEGLGGRTSYWPRGKVLGGSSSINAMVYCRGLPTDYEDWRTAGNPGWGWSEVEPVYRRIERQIDAQGRETGNGPLWVSDRSAEYHPLKRHYLAAARELGLPATANLNGAQPEGVAAYPITTRAGLRCSSADAFLHPALGRSNLVVRTGVLAQRVLFEGRRAVGLEVLQDGQRRRYRARAGVVLAAGAVNTPQLLQLSGIGPGPLLQRLGIELVQHNPAVGGALQDHLGISYFYRASEPTLNQVLGTWPGRLRAGLQFLLSRRGPLSLSVNQMGGLVRSSAGLDRPDIQLYFNPLSYSTTYVDRRPLMRPDRHPGFIMGFNSCRPTSLGRIDIASPDPAVAPRIQPNYLASAQDQADALAGARLIGRLQETQALRGLIAAPPEVDPARLGDADVIEDFRARSGTVYHACGTCRMAPEAAGGVVDATLRVHGVQGLRVADASVFPNITSANTGAPSILVGVRAAEFLLTE
ncbi:MAG: choline dehydrogenase [Rhodoferax sp.]|nr:choline dehydrogenase [Rhodoferax sp.]